MARTKKATPAGGQPIVRDFEPALKATKGLKKRLGRPSKPPKPGERVALGLRVTPEMKSKLEAAATQKGRSLSQEVEFRLEQSLTNEGHLILSKGSEWGPVLFMRNQMAIYVGEYEVVVIDITPEVKEKLLNAYDKDWRAQYEEEQYADYMANDAPRGED